MGKNLKVERSSNPPASSSAPSGIKTLPVSPIRNISGPSVKSVSDGGKKTNHTGIDGGTSVVSR